MKGRAFWIIVLLAAVGLAAVSWWRNRAASTPTAAAESPTGSRPSAPAKPKPEVAIEDGKTIDFSSGVPVVKDSAKEKAALDRAVKEMADATKNVTFGPRPPAPVTQQKAESPPVASPKP